MVRNLDREQTHAALRILRDEQGNEAKARMELVGAEWDGIEGHPATCMTCQTPFGGSGHLWLHEGCQPCEITLDCMERLRLTELATEGSSSHPHPHPHPPLRLCILCKQSLPQGGGGGGIHVCRSPLFTAFVVDATEVIHVDRGRSHEEALTRSIRGDIGMAIVFCRSTGVLSSTAFLVGKTILPIDERGVYSVSDVPRRRRLMEYSGEIVQAAAAEEEEEEDALFMNLDLKFGSVTVRKSPIHVGGIACLLNGAHEDRVNCIPTHSKGADGIPRMFLTSTRRIAAGTELFWDYKAECDRPEEELDCLCGCGRKLVTFVP